MLFRSPADAPVPAPASPDSLFGEDPDQEEEEGEEEDSLFGEGPEDLEPPSSPAAAAATAATAAAAPIPSLAEGEGNTAPTGHM